MNELYNIAGKKGLEAEDTVSDPEQKRIWPKVSQMQFSPLCFCARYYSLRSKRHCSAALQMQAECCARAWRLQADFEANSIVCSPLLCRIMRLEHRHLVLLIKVSNQMEVIRRQIPPALTVMESVIAVFVIIVSLIANDASVRLGGPF